MKLLISVIIAIFLVSSCATVNIGKVAPEYDGIDKRVNYIVKEYEELAKIQGIRFYNPVTIGFKKINRDNIVGVCTYGITFREIDIDEDYWQRASETSKFILLFHELTHCLCNRGHDFAKNKKYPEKTIDKITEEVFQKLTKIKNGYFDDGCPTSLMYPSVLDDDCTHAHYQEYIAEMFKRCRPW